MRSPSIGTEEESYDRSGSSGGGHSSAKDLFEQRKKYGKSMAEKGDVSEYRVEHLMTFTMERKGTILTVEDSIQKLKLMDARGKIWIQDLIMIVDGKNVRLIDCETKDIMEQFQLTHIQQAQPVQNACQYDSICCIVVRGPSDSAPDIHLFQCSIITADIICADINSALVDLKSKKGKKKRPETLRRYRDAIESASQPPSAPPINVRSRVAEWTIKAHNDLSSRIANGQAEDSPEMIIFRIHRDVDMLNHALDDIEVFVSSLKKSAMAAQELAKQQGKKKGSRNSRNGKQGGAGIMEARARLPSQERFLDLFQKFRFCFNLLSKLKEQIKDPNAVELTHFLFQPLALIIHNFSGFELPRKVQSPLFHRDTLIFLHNCTTTQEMHLLERLGDFWVKSRMDFPKEMYFPPYIPRFYSGWEPPAIPAIEGDSRGLAKAVAGQAKAVRRQEESWKASGSNIEDALQSPPDLTPPRNRQNGHGSPNAFKQHVQQHVARNKSFHSHSRKLCRVIYDFTARSENELSVKLDELLDVLDDSKSWWMVRNEKDELGYVPSNVVLLISKPLAKPTPPPVAPKTIPQPPPMVTPPPPPPPPPAPIPAPTLQPVPIYTMVQKKPVSKAHSKRGAVPVSSSMHEELRHRVASQNQRNFVLPKKTGNSTFLVVDRKSTTNDVFNWLRSLNFSESTVSSMGELTGAQIFALTRDEIKEICGDEGSRVYSQLMIQRSMDGYATVTEKSELSSVLKKIRETISEEGKEEEEE